MTKGGWRGKALPLYTPDAELSKILGSKPMYPYEIVKKFWDYVKAHSSKALVKVE